MKTKTSIPAPPPESRNKAGKADKVENWRERPQEEQEEEEDSEEEDEEPIRRSVPPIEKTPVLPYRHVIPLDHRSKDDRLEKINGSKSDDRAYRVIAPVQKPGVARGLVDKVLGTTVNIGIEELVGVAPEVREKLRKDLTKARRPVKTVALNVEPALPFENDDEVLQIEHDALRLEDLPIVNTMMVTTTSEDGIPEGAILLQDPVLQYHESLEPNEIPRQVYVETREIFVARDSASLRVLYSRINKQCSVESVLDSGSQIVSMSLETAVECQLAWDPDIQILMQSANASLEKSVGLARNVPFKFGDVTVYLQVHIIRKPAYKVLLGRPFEVLTECQINNHRDNTQFITLKDPNTGTRCTTSTAPRGANTNLSRKDPEVPVQADISQSKTADSKSNQAGFH